MRSELTPIIFHLDMDAFFAACTQLQNPELQNQPLVIAKNHRRAIVTTANYLARKCGIKTAMPLYVAKKLCPSLQQREPDFALYRFYSQKIWALLQKKFPSPMEIVSIDEAYFEMSSLLTQFSNPKNLAKSMQICLQNELGLSCSIGISTNKFLAKMASKLQKPQGISTLYPAEIALKLWPLPIEQMYGIGAATAKILQNCYQTKTIGELAKLSENELKQKIGQGGWRLVQHARGFGETQIKSQKAQPKSISTEITLEYSTNQQATLESLLLRILQTNYQRLQKKKLLTKTISVSLRYQWNREPHESFDKLKHLHRQSKQHTFKQHTDHFDTLFVQASFCLKNLYQSAKSVVLIGISFCNFIDKQNLFQSSLVIDSKTVSSEIIQLIQNINLQIGIQKVYLGPTLVKEIKAKTEIK